MSVLFSATVTPPQLHVRGGPKTTFESLRILVSGTDVDVIGIDATGTWGQIVQNADVSGWISLKYVRLTAAASNLLDIACPEIGVRENPDRAQAHPRIVQYLASVDSLSATQRSSDETPWCSCFVNWCVERAGLHGTNSAAALSWHDWRTGVALDGAATGDIAVFTRHSPTQNGGHVAFFIRSSEDKTHVLLLGGNQSDAVRYGWYPVNDNLRGTAYRLISVRRP